MNVKRSPWHHRTLCVAALLAPAGVALLMPGCARKPAAALAPAPDPVDPMATMAKDVDTRGSDLQRQSAELAKIAGELPHNNSSDDRDTLREVFMILGQVLPNVAGPNASGVFGHQLSVVSDTRAQLSGRFPDLSTDQIVDRGLRASRNALTEAAQASYYQDPKITAALDKLNTKVQDLDAYIGPAHPMAVASAIQQTSQVISAMSEVLGAKMNEASGPLFMPTTGPSTPPTTEPAGPATTLVPATEPAAPAPAPATPAAAIPPATEPSPAAPPAAAPPAPAIPPEPAPSPATPTPAPPEANK